jgi:hypothetical protein
VGQGCHLLHLPGPDGLDDTHRDDYDNGRDLGAGRLSCSRCCNVKP